MIEITERAATHIQRMLEKRGADEAALRVAVKAGGCSGLEYVFKWESEATSSDIVFTGPGGARVFVDPKSLQVLDGTVLDYDTSLLSKGFVLNNPHAKNTCGCGVSFSV
jgi:iron-sulfur cluster assembly protein